MQTNICYLLEFDTKDKLKYVGITKDLNSRLDAHKEYWATQGLKILGCKVLYFGTEVGARKVETAYIKQDSSGNLLNKSQYISKTGHISRLDVKLFDDILSPTELYYNIKKLPEAEKLSYLRGKYTQLENRYITLYMQLQKMQNNIEHIDEIITEATINFVRRKR